MINNCMVDIHDPDKYIHCHIGIHSWRHEPILVAYARWFIKLVWVGFVTWAASEARECILSGMFSGKGGGGNKISHSFFSLNSFLGAQYGPSGANFYLTHLFGGMEFEFELPRPPRLPVRTVKNNLASQIWILLCRICLDGFWLSRLEWMVAGVRRARLWLRSARTSAKGCGRCSILCTFIEKITE